MAGADTFLYPALFGLVLAICGFIYCLIASDKPKKNDGIGMKIADPVEMNDDVGALPPQLDCLNANQTHFTPTTGNPVPPEQVIDMRAYVSPVDGPTLNHVKKQLGLNTESEFSGGNGPITEHRKMTNTTLQDGVGNYPIAGTQAGQNFKQQVKKLCVNTESHHSSMAPVTEHRQMVNPALYDTVGDYPVSGTQAGNKFKQQVKKLYVNTDSNHSSVVNAPVIENETMTQTTLKNAVGAPSDYPFSGTKAAHAYKDQMKKLCVNSGSEHDSAENMIVNDDVGTRLATLTTQLDAVLNDDQDESPVRTRLASLSKFKPRHGRSKSTDRVRKSIEDLGY